MSHRLGAMTALRSLATIDHPGDVLRERRIALGWTQAELAERSGIPQADVSRIENGRLDARWSTIHRLSKALTTGKPARRSLANGNRRTPRPTTGPPWAPTNAVLPVEHD